MRQNNRDYLRGLICAVCRKKIRVDEGADFEDRASAGRDVMRVAEKCGSRDKASAVFEPRETHGGGTFQAKVAVQPT